MNFHSEISITRRHPDSNWGIKDLQSIALPLDYTAYLRNYTIVIYLFIR